MAAVNHRASYSLPTFTKPLSIYVSRKLEKALKIITMETINIVALKQTLKSKTKERSLMSSEQWTWMILITNHLTLNSTEILLGKS